MKRVRTDLLALGIAVLGTGALFTLLSGAASEHQSMSACRAKAAAASYLGTAPSHAERHGPRRAVTDGQDTAWIDARSGELVEIEFAPH